MFPNTGKIPPHGDGDGGLFLDREFPVAIFSAVTGYNNTSTVDTKCDALCLTHSKPESVASIGFPGAS